jgi:hypothetical protein
MMLDVRGYSSDETREFYEQINGSSPRQRVGFLTRPPRSSRIHGPVKSPAIVSRADSGGDG